MKWSEVKWKTAHQAAESSMSCQIPGDSVFKTHSWVSCCSHAYWKLTFRRGIVFQYKCFALIKIQKRGRSLNTSKNVKYSNKISFIERLWLLTSQTWPASVKIRRLQDWFFSTWPGGFLYLLLMTSLETGQDVIMCVFGDTQYGPVLDKPALALPQCSKAHLSGLHTLVCRVSQLGRQYPQFHQEGKILYANPSSDIRLDEPSEFGSWHSVLTPWRIVYVHRDLK